MDQWITTSKFLSDQMNRMETSNGTFKHTNRKRLNQSSNGKIKEGHIKEEKKILRKFYSRLSFYVYVFYSLMGTLFCIGPFLSVEFQLGLSFIILVEVLILVSLVVSEKLRNWMDVDV